MDSLEELKARFEAIKKLGYITSDREGDTGIGKTLEEKLGIRENNIQSPDILGVELKAARKKSPSMLTLMTKTPLPSDSLSNIMLRYSYISPKTGKPVIHTTIDALCYNRLKTKEFCKVNIRWVNGKISVVLDHKTDGIIAYWDDSQLRDLYHKKYPNGRLFYVKADSIGSKKDEQFYFKEAYLYSGFTYDKFIKLISDGTIKVDLRVGTYPDGRPHDHGTGFRVKVKDMNKLFDKCERLI